MNKLFVILALPLLLNASKILSYNVYDRTDRVDVMITFDTPYKGKIKQSISSSKIVIKLEGASIESNKSKSIGSEFLTTLNIVPLATYTKIIANIPNATKLQASKTSDAYGLRLRFSNPVTGNNKINKVTKESYSLPTKKTDEFSSSYYIVIVILFIGIIILFILKNKIASQTNNTKSNSWLFKDSSKSQNSQTKDEVSIRFQKNINEQSSVVMLDFVGQSYLVLMGNTNVLLDKFTDDKPVTQDEFETILQNKHQVLDEFLNEDSDMQERSIEKDPMQIYKEKAANISYTV